MIVVPASSLENRYKVFYDFYEAPDGSIVGTHTILGQRGHFVYRDLEHFASEVVGTYHVGDTLTGEQVAHIRKNDDLYALQPRTQAEYTSAWAQMRREEAAAKQEHDEIRMRAETEIRIRWVKTMEDIDRIDRSLMDHSPLRLDGILDEMREIIRGRQVEESAA